MGRQTVARIGSTKCCEWAGAYHRHRGQGAGAPRRASAQRRARSPVSASRRLNGARGCGRLPHRRVPARCHPDPRDGQLRCPARARRPRQGASGHREDDRAEDRRGRRRRRDSRSDEAQGRGAGRGRELHAPSRARPEDGAAALEGARHHDGGRPQGGGRGAGAARSRRPRAQVGGEDPRRARQAAGGGGPEARAPRHGAAEAAGGRGDAGRAPRRRPGLDRRLGTPLPRDRPRSRPDCDGDRRSGADRCVL